MVGQRVGFNPSYGLHALRAGARWRSLQALPAELFQSLIWVACPTGVVGRKAYNLPLGFNPSYGLHALRACKSIVYPHERSSFNPSYGLHALRAPREGVIWRYDLRFNPSYGLHALRAFALERFVRCNLVVSIPHMGCMPYGLGRSYGCLQRLV